MTVQLFIPCYIDQFSPHVAHSFCNLLDKLNISWNYPEAQTCCGQFAFNAGDWQSARRLMRHFFQVFNGQRAHNLPQFLMCSDHPPPLSCPGGKFSRCRQSEAIATSGL